MSQSSRQMSTPVNTCLVCLLLCSLQLICEVLLTHRSLGLFHTHTKSWHFRSISSKRIFPVNFHRIIDFCFSATFPQLELCSTFKKNCLHPPVRAHFSHILANDHAFSSNKREILSADKAGYDCVVDCFLEHLRHPTHTYSGEGRQICDDCEDGRVCARHFDGALC